MPGEEYTPEDIARLYEEYTGEEVAALTQWKVWRVYATLHALGVEVRPQGRQTVLENPGIEFLQSLLDEGYSQQDIANLRGVSKRTVQRWLGK